MNVSMQGICEILSQCNQNGMIFSPAKFEFAKETVEFAGFKINIEEIKPTDKYVEAIRIFPTPNNISKVRGWFGLINQLAYSLIKTEHMAPFRHILSQSTPFQWNDDLEVTFKRSMDKITELNVDGVASFEMELFTCLNPDCSKRGWIGSCSRRDAHLRRSCPHDVRKAGHWYLLGDTSATRLRRTIPR
jgi:hypothetical protein